jgi:hypothetical protein
MATPMAAPTSTSVGASAPSATRASPTRVTTPVAANLPRWRQRPSGTSVYRTTTRVAARCITGSDGRAQPPQPASMSTPKGRGRCVPDATTSGIVVSSWATISAMIRCRNRRSPSSASTSPKPRRLRTHQEPRKASACQVPVSPGAFSPASHLTTASSRTVTVTAGPRRPPSKTAIDRTTSTTKATSQPTPLVCR